VAPTTPSAADVPGSTNASRSPAGAEPVADNTLTCTPSAPPVVSSGSLPDTERAASAVPASGPSSEAGTGVQAPQRPPSRTRIDIAVPAGTAPVHVRPATAKDRVLRAGVSNATRRPPAVAGVPVPPGVPVRSVASVPRVRARPALRSAARAVRSTPARSRRTTAGATGCGRAGKASAMVGSRTARGWTARTATSGTASLRTRGSPRSWQGGSWPPGTSPTSVPVQEPLTQVHDSSTTNTRSAHRRQPSPG
jgi:hypothetical protein